MESDEAATDGPQKRFCITLDGERSLAEWLRTPPDLSSPPRDELVIKVLVALEVPSVDVLALIQAHRRHLVEAMQRYTRLKEDATEEEVAFVLVVDAEIYRLDAVIRWLDSASTRVGRRAPLLTAAAKQPPAEAREPRPVEPVEVDR